MDEATPKRTEAPTVPTGPVDRLGIVVVYALKHDDDVRLLELHLERVARHTHVPYTLFATMPRLSETARRLVLAAPNVVLCDIAPTERRSSREHGYYLDAMVPLALAAGVSHVCTLDVDSFPIDDGWVDALLQAAPPESGVVGILRAENGDVALPHPSCIMAPRAFFERYEPSFWPEPESTPEFERFVRATGQSADTGIRLASILWNERLAWGRLLRTNKVNPHYLLAGIYGDVVFHLGGITRGKVFRTDLAGSRVHKLSRPMEWLPVRGRAMKAAQRRLLRRVRGPAEAALAAHNRVAYTELRGRLLDDPDGLFADLRGAPASDRGAAGAGGATAAATAGSAPRSEIES